MSEEHARSYFADQVDPYFDEGYGVFLGTDDFGPDIPYDDAYGFGAGQDLANVELAGVTAQPEYAADTLGMAGGEESSQNGISPPVISGQASMYGETPQSTTAPVPQHSGYDSRQTSFPGDSSFGHFRTQEGNFSVANQYTSDEDQTWRDHEELSNFHNTARDNGQGQFLNNVSTEDWEALAGTGGFQETADFVYHEPNSHGMVNNTLNPTPARVNSGQPTIVNRPGMESAHGTAGMSSGKTRGPVLATSNGLGRTPHHSSSGDRNPTVSVVAESSAATENANNNESDEENQDNEEDEDDEEEDVPSHVTFETYEENDPVIVQDPHQNGRGRTGVRNGRQVWLNPRTSKWQPSVSHHEMRPTLIARAQAEYPNDRYLHPDPTDGLPYGETAFFKPHQNRGPERQDCANILFEWREYQPRKDANGKSIRNNKPKYIRKHPGFMYEGDRIVLDPHDNPVVNHKFIPLTLSARTTGAKLQEMYLHPDCRQVDLWARMPRWERMRDKKGNLVIVELRKKNTRINMPMLRFREKKGTIAGEDREGSDVIRDGLLSFYLQNGFDPVASGNSTKGFWRDLKGWEVKEVKLRNAAMFGKRAGDRAIPEDQRQENLQKTKASIENGKRKRAEENRGDTGMRPHDQIADVDVTGRAPNKRVYQEPAFAPSHIRVAASSVRGNTGESSRQGRGNKASSSKTQRYGTHGGAVQTPHLNPNPMAVYQQPVHQQPQYPHYSQQYQLSQPGFGMERAANRVPLLSTIQQGGQTWSVRSPYQLNGRPDTQRGPDHSNLGQASTTGQYVPQHILRQAVERENSTMPPPASGQGYGFQGANNGYALPQTFGGQRQGGLDESEYNPYVIEENRQRMLRQGRSDQFARANMVPKRPMPNTNPGDILPAHASTHHYGQAVERPAPFAGTNGALKPNGNTLGRGGHKTYQAPKQVLGKRGQQGAGDVIAPNQYPESRIPTTSNRIQQEQVIGQTIPAPDVGPSQKRQRNNGTSGPTPRPQRRRQGAKAPQPKRYGAGGAPEPIPLPEEALNPTNDILADAESRLKSAEELYEAMAPIFGSNSTGNENGNVGDMLDEKTVLEYDWDAAGRDLDLDQPQQPHMDEPESRVYQAPHVEDEHPIPPQQPHMDEPNLNVHQAPQVEDEQLTPQLLDNNDDAPPVADAQGPDPPRAPSPAQAGQEVAFDIRDVRPTDGWQSQSLKNALAYTREAYSEWTGEEAPDTKLEDCFNAQNRQIQTAFQLWWRSEKNPQRSDPLPELYQVEAWSGSVENWRAPENIDHLWEPLRWGKFAPRNEDGSLMEPQFHWNAEKYEWYDAEVVGQL